MAIISNVIWFWRHHQNYCRHAYPVFCFPYNNSLRTQLLNYDGNQQQQHSLASLLPVFITVRSWQHDQAQTAYNKGRQNMHLFSCNLFSISCARKILSQKIMQHCFSSCEWTWPHRTVHPLSRPWRSPSKTYLVTTNTCVLAHRCTLWWPYLSYFISD